MKSILILLLTTLTCLADVIIGPNKAILLAAETITPTNLPGGFSAFSWWEPSISPLVTNSSTAILPNLTSAGTIYDLTNTIGAGTPLTQAAQLNGHACLRFIGGSGATVMLKSERWTNFVPFEIVVVMAMTNTLATAYMFDSAVSSENGHLREVNQIYSVGSSTGLAHADTNKYMVINAIFSTNATVCTIFTNNVASTTNSGSTTQKRGMFFGSNTGGNFGQVMSVASIFAFTNQILTPTARLAAYQYCTNKFGPFP